MASLRFIRATTNQDRTRFFPCATAWPPTSWSSAPISATFRPRSGYACSRTTKSYTHVSPMASETEDGSTEALGKPRCRLEALDL